MLLHSRIFVFFFFFETTASVCCWWTGNNVVFLFPFIPILWSNPIWHMEATNRHCDIQPPIKRKSVGADTRKGWKVCRFHLTVNTVVHFTFGSVEAPGARLYILYIFSNEDWSCKLNGYVRPSVCPCTLYLACAFPMLVLVGYKFLCLYDFSPMMLYTPLNTQVVLRCEIPHSLTRGSFFNFFFFYGSETVEMFSLSAPCACWLSPFLKQNTNWGMPWHSLFRVVFCQRWFAFLYQRNGSYRSLKRNSSVCQTCDCNTKQHWLCNRLKWGSEHLRPLHQFVFHSALLYGIVFDSGFAIV